MTRIAYLLGFFASFLLSSGFMFKIMHWPTANVQICLGFLVLNFGFLPVYFYGKLKMAR